MFNQIQYQITEVPIQGGEFSTYFYPNRDWIGFGFRPTLTEEQARLAFMESVARRRAGQVRDHGWKMHISIEDVTPGNLERGWNSILPILQEKRIKHGKIVYVNKPGYTPFASTRADDHLYGKQITIYCFSQSDNQNMPQMQQFWQEFATEITETLRRNEVHCAPLPGSDMAIQGSEYMSYRDDSGGKDGPDPFLHIRIGGNQAPRPTYPVIPAPPPIPAVYIPPGMRT